MADNVQLLLDEFDAFLAGRGIEDIDEYLALRRRGGGSGLGRADRERVFAAFEEHRTALRKRRVWDWPQIRIEALRLAEKGAGPRYDGVIIDEAQLSAVGMRLLLALDESENHRHFLIVGDGQQSVHPGGFGLREVASTSLAVRGSSCAFATITIESDGIRPPGSRRQEVWPMARSASSSAGPVSLRTVTGSNSPPR